jgi:trigger factor
MRVTEGKAKNGKIKLNVFIPPEELSGYIAKAHDDMKKKITVEEGQNLIEAAKAEMGEEKFEKYFDNFVIEESTPLALEKKNYRIVTNPHYYVEMPVEEGKEFKYSMEIIRKPSISLSSYDPVEVTVPTAEVSEREVDLRIEQVAHENLVLEKSQNAVVKEGGKVVLKIENTINNGKPMPTLDTESRPYDLGEDLMPRSFDDALIGMNAGQTKDIEFDAPSLEKTDDSGRPLPELVTATVTVLEVQTETEPVIDDAWVAAHEPGLSTLAEFRDKAREEIRKQKEEELVTYTEYQCVSALTERVAESAPKELYEEMQKSVARDFRRMLQREGISKEQYMQALGLSEGGLNMKLMTETYDALMQGLALDALYEHLKLELTDEDFEEYFTDEDLEGPGRRYMAVEAACRIKASKWLVDNAIVKTTEGL